MSKRGVQKGATDSGDSITLDNENLINHTDLKYRSMLKDLQGNILKGHDRDYVVLLFLRFNTDKDKPENLGLIKQRMGKWADRITSAKLQLDEWKLFHEKRIVGGTFVNFFLTKTGYEALGFKEQLTPENFDPKFLCGMQGSQSDLNDPDPRTWDKDYIEYDEGSGRYKAKEIHALLLLADDDEQFLGHQIRIVLRDVVNTDDNEPLVDIVAVERGKVQRRRDDKGKMQPVEHFGYFDGISNPIFLESDVPERVKDLGGDSEWNPWAPLSVALVKDPLNPHPQSFGSYMVYRKLEQDVKDFAYMKKELARELFFYPEAKKLRENLENFSTQAKDLAVSLDQKLKRDDLEKCVSETKTRTRELTLNVDTIPEADTEPTEIQIRTAGALVMGRYDNGTPITMVTTLGADLAYQVELSNNFTYKEDPGDGSPGSKCPLHAHIRKANPRTDPQVMHKPGPRIVRRGITYGERAEGLAEPHDDLPSGGVGLLFMCFQRDIAKQFEGIQKLLNSRDKTGPDPVAGQRAQDESSEEQVWPVPGAEKSDQRVHFKFHVFDFVKLRGGEYFFAPSISFLQNIGKAP